VESFKLFPVPYNSSEGVRALGFIEAQIDAGIKPQKDHFWGKEFLDRKFAVMLEGSWLSSDLPKEKEFEEIQFIPMFQVPDNKTQTSTLMG
jgi:multiple sugar transport system substrate-binding protein